MSLAELLLKLVELLWPLRIVAEYEHGCVYRCGKYVRTVGPGCYFVIPWFWSILEINRSRGIISTGRQDITTKDAGTLSYSATAPIWVKDAAVALNEVDEVRETAQELFTSVLSERLADVDANRLTPESRGRLVSDLQRWANEEARVFGLEFGRVRFTSFLRDPKTFRLLADSQAAANW